MTPNARILIIDDNTAIHDDFRKILCPDVTSSAVDELEASLFDSEAAPTVASAFEVDSAYQGREGLVKVEQALVENRPYALAFVDGRMPPGWDGVETIAHLWKANLDLQVVICTAYPDYSWEQIIERVGQSDSLVILKKPFDAIEVLQMAHAMTKKWTLNRQVRAKTETLEELVRDRTQELEATNQSLLQAKEVAEASNRAKSEFLGEAIRIVSHAATQKALALTSFVDEQVPATLRGDPTRLRQVMLNLLSNAIKFTATGCVHVTLRVEDQQEGAVALRVEVKDTGAGIAPEVQENLFAPFTQADSSTTRRFFGTGLGLAISRRLVGMMGGTIGVTSSLGQGSTFHFTVHLMSSAISNARAA